MKRLTACLVLLTLFFVPGPAFTLNHQAVAALLNSSVVQLIGMDPETGLYGGYCSGFVIDGRRDYVLTADHCVANELDNVWVTGTLALVVARLSLLDIAILKVKGIGTRRLALKPRTAPLYAGLDVIAAGFGWGWPNNQRRAGILSNVASIIRHPSRTDEHVSIVSDGWVEFDFAVAQGNSGGPIVDDQGRVVSVISAVRSALALWGKSIHDIYPATRAYWGR